VSTEATVIAVAAAIYLFDCVVLLERGQALWTKSGMAFGSLHYQVRGRAVALLNPLTPFIPVFRTAPLFSAPSGADAAVAVKALAPLSYLGLLQLLLVLAALPFCLYLAPGWPFFVALLLAFVNALLMLVLIAWRFDGTSMPRRPLVALGFGWLACLPLSINSVRKAGLALDINSDARKLIESMSGDAKERARASLAAQLTEALVELEDGDERRTALALLKSELESGNGRL
jgi:hypothetical protein